MSMPASELSLSEANVIQRIVLVVWKRFQTPANTFGLWKDYLYRPSYDLDTFVSAEDLYHPHSSVAIISDTDRTEEPLLYTNKTTRHVLEWQNSGSTTKSNEKVTCLVCKVLLHPKFQLEHLLNFNATRENQKADAAEKQLPSKFLTTFQCTNIRIDVPSGNKLVSPRMVSIPGLYYCKITTLIKESFESPIFQMFHLSPFKLFRQHPYCKASECMYSEMYDLDVFLEEHDKVQRAPSDDPTCKREKVVTALMFWSDATHLATFGTAKPWPIYMLFGNLSKYVRCQPNSGTTKHVAYIPPFPDALRDELKSFHEKWDTQQKDVLAHCRQALMHGVWKHLLNDKFLHAYRYGMIVQCYDGTE
jgi:Plavaka transposase